MASPPRVSVIIPAYNAQATLRETLASATAQTLRDIEIVVVNDGSTDATAAIVEDAARTDPRIRLIDTSNGGTARARNIGIAATTAPFIAPLDADDVWHPSKLAKQLERLQDDPDAGFAYSPYRLIDPAGYVLRSFPVFGCEGSVFYQHLYVNFVGNGSSVLMRRSCVEEVGLYDEKIGARTAADYLLQLKLALRYDVALAPDYLVGYRLVPGSSSSSSQAVRQSRIEVLEAARGMAPGPLPTFLEDWILADIRLTAALQDVKRGQFRPGLAGILAAAALDPRRLLPELVGRACRFIHQTAVRAEGRPRLLFTEMDAREARTPPDRPTLTRLAALRRLDSGRHSSAQLDKRAQLPSFKSTH